MFLWDLVTVSLLNVLVIIIRFVLEPIGFACVIAPIDLSSDCNVYTLGYMPVYGNPAPCRGFLQTYIFSESPYPKVINGTC